MHKNSDEQKKHHICRHFKTSFCQKAILWKGFYRHNMSSSSSFVSKGRDEALRNGEKKIITHKLSTIKVSIWQHDFLICSSRMSHWRGEGSLCLRAGQRLTRWRMLRGPGVERNKPQVHPTGFEGGMWHVTAGAYVSSPFAYNVSAKLHKTLNPY